MALHPQQSVEADSRSDILHQLTILFIGYNAPTLTDVAASKKHKITSTKKTFQKTSSSSNRTLTIASAPNADVPADATPPRSEGNK